MGAQRPSTVQGGAKKRLREEVKAIKADAKRARQEARRAAKGGPKRPAVR
jgi:hypothetical protein